MEDEYDSFSDFIRDIPPHSLFAKRKLTVYHRKRDALHDEIYIVFYSTSHEVQVHDSVIYMKEVKTGKIYKMDKERLEKELSELLTKYIDPKEVAKDMVQDLSSLDLIDAYDRAIVQKGKIHADSKVGLFNIKIYGKRKPLRLLVGRQ